MIKNTRIYNNGLPTMGYQEPYNYHTSDHMIYIGKVSRRKELIHQYLPYGMPESQGGKGLLDGDISMMDVYHGLKKTGEFLYNAYTSPLGTSLKNLYGNRINPHPLWRPGMVGEAHMIHSSGNTYNFAG